MSVPADFTTLNITGKFTMNKTLTNMNDADRILALQGVGWFKRKIITTGTVTLFIKHYKNESNEENIDIDQVFTGGISGTSEYRTLNWTERENYDHVFGFVIGKSRRLNSEQLEGLNEFLKTGWSEDSFEKGLIQAYAWSNTAKSKMTWTANQLWGVEIVNGERRYVRHVDFTGSKGESIQTKLVYDYLEPLNS